SVGILITPNLPAVSWLSSTSNLTIWTLSLSSPSISSKTGAIILHGPHHGAQKSTNTNPSAVSLSKVSSVAFFIAIIYSSNRSLVYLITPYVSPTSSFSYSFPSSMFGVSSVDFLISSFVFAWSSLVFGWSSFDFGWSSFDFGWSSLDFGWSSLDFGWSSL